MTPPVRAGAAQRTGSTTTDSDFLNVEQLLRDPAQAADPSHFATQWRDSQAFRLEHSTLYLALDALRTIFSRRQESISPGQAAALREFRGYAVTHPEGVEVLALRNLQRSLAGLRGEGESRARSVLEIVGQPPAGPANPHPPETPRSQAASSGFQFTALNLNFHLFDREMRVLPHVLTLGVLPQDQVPGYNLSSTFSGSLGAEYTFGGFRFFTDLNYQHGLNPQGAPASHFDQFGLGLGLIQYSGAGRGQGLHFSVGGRSRIGLQLGATWCTGIDGSEISGVHCPEAVGQLSLINDSDLLSFGYGPVVASVRMLQSTSAVYFGSTHLPSTYRVPVEFGLTWYLQPLLPEPTSTDPEELLQQRVTTQDMVFDILRIGANGLQDFNAFTTEAAYQGVRDLAVRNAFGSTGSSAQYSLTELGSFAGGLLTGFSRGSTAYRLQRDVRHGNDLQRALILVPMLLEPVIHGIHAAANQPSAGNPPALEAQASYMALPISLTSSALVALGALGALGDRSHFIRTGEVLGHFQLAHAASALLGAVLILTSGDGSGNGFLGWSSLGNSYSPRPEGLDYGNNRFQHYRLTAGSMLLSYGVAGLLDIVSGRIEYLTRRDRQRQGAEAAPPARPSSGIEGLRVGFETDGQTRVMASVGGRF